jgi:hypothetical protein
MNTRVRSIYELMLRGWYVKSTSAGYYWCCSQGISVRFRLGGELDEWLSEYLI